MTGMEGFDLTALFDLFQQIIELIKAFFGMGATGA